MEQDILPVDD